MDVREMLSKVRWASLNQILDPFLFVLLRFSILWRAYRLAVRALRWVRRSLCPRAWHCPEKEAAIAGPSVDIEQQHNTCPFEWLRHHIAHRDKSHAVTTCKLCVHEFGNGEQVGMKLCAYGAEENGNVAGAQDDDAGGICFGASGHANEAAVAGWRMSESHHADGTVAADFSGERIHQQMQEQQTELQPVQQTRKSLADWHIERISERTERTESSTPAATAAPAVRPMALQLVGCNSESNDRVK